VPIECKAIDRPYMSAVEADDQAAEALARGLREGDLRGLQGGCSASRTQIAEDLRSADSALQRLLGSLPPDVGGAYTRFHIDVTGGALLDGSLRAR